MTGVPAFITDKHWHASLFLLSVTYRMGHRVNRDLKQSAA